MGTSGSWKFLIPAQFWQRTTSRLMEAQSGLAEPQSPHSLLSGFSHRRIITLLLDSALLMVEDRLSNQLDRSLADSTDMLQELEAEKRGGDFNEKTNNTSDV